MKLPVEVRRFLVWSPLLLLVWLGLLLLWPLSQPPLPTLSNQPLLIHNVQLIDVLTGEVRAGQSVWIDDGRIQRISPTAGSNLADSPSGKWHRIDGNNRFLIPGLQDMHSHSMQLSPQIHHSLWLAAGVTSLRDMSGCVAASDSFIACSADRKLWQQQMRQGLRSSPRYRYKAVLHSMAGLKCPTACPPI